MGHGATYRFILGTIILETSCLFSPSPAGFGYHLPTHFLPPGISVHLTSSSQIPGFIEYVLNLIAPCEMGRGCFYPREMLLRESTSHLLNLITSSSSGKPFWITLPVTGPFSEFTGSTFWFCILQFIPFCLVAFLVPLSCIVINVSYTYVFFSSTKF